MTTINPLNFIPEWAKNKEEESFQASKLKESEIAELDPSEVGRLKIIEKVLGQYQEDRFLTANAIGDDSVRTLRGATLAEHDDMMTLIYPSEKDHEIYYTSTSKDKLSWSAPKKFGYRTFSKPAACQFKTKYGSNLLLIAYRSEYNYLHLVSVGDEDYPVISLQPEKIWDLARLPKFETFDPPAMVEYYGELVLAFRSANDVVWYTHASRMEYLGEMWNKFEGISSKYGPSLTVSEGKLCCAIVNQNDEIMLAKTDTDWKWTNWKNTKAKTSSAVSLGVGPHGSSHDILFGVFRKPGSIGSVTWFYVDWDSYTSLNELPGRCIGDPELQNVGGKLYMVYGDVTE
jgi:hypothetical protein